MIAHLPHWLNLTFILITIVAIWLFHLSNGKPKKLTALIVLWSILQSVLAYTGFYHDLYSIPPRFGLVLIPATLLIIYGLLPKQINWVMQNRNIHISTFLHTIRIAVEIVLFYLFVYKMVPELMTFEGRNFDVLAGITAPIVGWLYWRGNIGGKGLMAWNIVALGLVLFILSNGLLSAELPFQQFGFEQPNKAVEYFPFVLLPATVVPIVVYTHISDIIKLSYPAQFSLSKVRN